MSAGNENFERPCGECRKESSQGNTICLCENSKTRNGATCATIKRRRYSPDSAVPVSQLLLFFVSVLLQAIRRICNNRMPMVRRLVAHPLQAIRVKQGIACASDFAMY